MTSTLLYVIDVAHPPRDPGTVEDELLDSWSHVRNSKNLRLLKIIHGYGRSGKGGTTKEYVRNWAYENQQRFISVVPGENYDLFNSIVQEMRRELGEYGDIDIGKANSGITLIWVK